jgi:polysaccharide export outer membrane protein
MPEFIGDVTAIGATRLLEAIRKRQKRQMKRFIYAGVIGSWVFLISTLIAYPQADKEVLLKKEPEAEVLANRDHYVIGCQDLLSVQVWKEEALSRTLPVRMDGNISLPLVREIKAAGLTPLQLEAVITERLKGFYENPTVSVIVMEANSFKVYVSGEVKKPNVYRLRSETTLLQIISMAGGFTDWAKRTKILIIRRENGKESRITVNYKKAMKGDPGSNVVLRPGDTIIVEASASIWDKKLVDYNSVKPKGRESGSFRP